MLTYANTVPHLSVQSVPSSGGPRGGHAVPGDDDGADGLLAVVSGERSPDVLAGLAQDRRAAVLPEVDRPLSVAVVQVSQHGGDHFETGGHLPQVLVLRRRFHERHESIGINLEQKVGRRFRSEQGLSQSLFGPGTSRTATLKHEDQTAPIS